MSCEKFGGGGGQLVFVYVQVELRGGSGGGGLPLGVDLLTCWLGGKIGGGCARQVS